MEWNEIEGKWRNKQNSKEIKPSDQAWELLSGELDKHKSKKETFNYLKWCSIAACLFLGGYMIHVLMSDSFEGSTLEFEEPSFQTITPKVVYQEEDIVKKENSPREDVYVKRNTTSVSEKIARVSIANIDEQIIEEEKELILIGESKELGRESIGADKTLISKNIDVRTAIIKVDSNLLLDQVEEELEMEFRETKVEKIYETAKRVIVDISNSKYEK